MKGKRHESVSAYTARKLRQVSRKILGEPKQFLMDAFYSTHLPFNIPNCGTAACIAGWATSVSLKLNPAQARTQPVDPLVEAMNSLGIDKWQADALFFADNWPDGYWERWLRIPDHHAGRRAKLAVKRIEHFISTGE